MGSAKIFHSVTPAQVVAFQKDPRRRGTLLSFRLLLLKQIETF